MGSWVPFLGGFNNHHRPPHTELKRDGIIDVKITLVSRLTKIKIVVGHRKYDTWLGRSSSFRKVYGKTYNFYSS